MLNDKTYGLFMGDSILHGYLDQNIELHQKFKDSFNLDVIETQYEKGRTLNFFATKVFPRQMAKIINENDNDAMVDIFLSAGAVDLSDAITDDLQFDYKNFISRRNDSLFKIVDHPGVRHLYYFPITPRKICNGRLCERFPKYSKKQWISFANVCIAKINQANFQFHSKLKLVHFSPDLHHCISNDGIHLTEQGKHLLLHSVFKSEEKQMFSNNDFPLQQG